ncbi:MAG TPA: hypothetical protein VE912_13465, partial [Bacteroidales bacterium]|nr:hypothetical protein [Bacteroidales bacterium]
MKAIYLRPLSPFHLQTGSLDHESVESFPKADTLSAAITFLWFREYRELSGFPDAIPFRISSMMPAVLINSDYIRCYPKPIGLSIDPDKIDHKVFKNIQYVTEPVFEKWRSGNL